MRATQKSGRFCAIITFNKGAPKLNLHAPMLLRKSFLIACSAVFSVSAATPLQISPGPYSSGKVYVSCIVDGVKERCFLDTGSAMTLVANSKRFRSYTNIGNLRFESAAGIPQQTETIQLGSIEIDRLASTNKKVGRIKFRGAETTVGIDIVGRQPFALHFQPKAILELNAPRPQLPMTTLQVSPQGLLSIPLELGGRTARALWDTGAALTSIDENFIAAHPENFQPTKNFMNGVDGAGKSILVQVFRAKEIRIADHTFKNVRVVGVDLTMLRNGVHKDVQAVVGFNLIREANWFFDPKSRLWNCEPKP